MTATIAARALTKRYGKVHALAGVDLEIGTGVTALLGPNGAGKTTFVRSVATLVRPDGGTLHVGGYDVATQPREVRRLIGLAGQAAAVEDAMTGRENLEMTARLYGVGRREARAGAAGVLEKLGLHDAADRYVRTYSGGMRRRLDLGASLVGEPRLLLLDEPTSGLDPRGRMELWGAIRALATGGTDVLLTTQYLDEADHLATRIVIIDRGQVIADGTPAALKGRAGRDVIDVHTASAGDTAPAANALRRIADDEPRVDPATRHVSISVDGGADLLLAAVRALDEAHLAVEDIALRRPTLDEVFLALTGQGLPDRSESQRSTRRHGRAA
ncbi:MAG TPA: ATP-binding cassette domain-containing protein [Acidimicrobiales bacterium]|nr:ATP-binding cassette domain-containing protein [Acidimicrobiales bacterium]